MFLLAGCPSVCLRIVCWRRLVSGSSRLRPSARCRRLLFKTDCSCFNLRPRATRSSGPGLVCVSPCGLSFWLPACCLLVTSRERKLAAASFRSLPSPRFRNRLLLLCNQAPLGRVWCGFLKPVVVLGEAGGDEGTALLISTECDEAPASRFVGST